MTFDPKTASDADCELHIIRALIDAARAQGCLISVNDGGAWTVVQSSDPEEILKALRTTGEDIVRFFSATRGRLGEVFLIYGNEPHAVIADHSDNDWTNSLVDWVSPVIDRIEEAKT